MGSKITALGFIIFLAGCSSKMERDYIRGCSADGVPEEICSCAFEKLEEQFSEETFDRMEKTGMIPDGFMEANIHAATTCAAEH